MVSTRSASRSASVAPEPTPIVSGTGTGDKPATSALTAKTPRRTARLSSPTAAAAAVPASTSTSPTAISSTSPTSPTLSASPLPPPVWSHTPTATTRVWLAVSLPLVLWDTAYMLLRPATMKGGALHWPLFAPYDLYGRVDHVYGWKAFHARAGFSAAQSWMNVVETVLYLSYAYLSLAGGRR